MSTSGVPVTVSEPRTADRPEVTVHLDDDRADPNGDRHAITVAIDGPSGAGKSTVARGVARRLGFRYLDTGALYRALTWIVLALGIDPTDEAAVAAAAESGAAAISIALDPSQRPAVG